MVSVSEAGLSRYSSCSELHEGKACVSHRSPLANGELLVCKFGEVHFDATVALERLHCQGFLVLGQFGYDVPLCYYVELFS